MAKTNDPIAYILCYTIRIKHRESNIDIDTDQWEVFSERDASDRSPVQQADSRLKELEEQYENSSVAELYTWNIGKVVKTNEWYKTAH